jgi:hypothetical protein
MNSPQRSLRYQLFKAVLLEANTIEARHAQRLGDDEVSGVMRSFAYGRVGDGDFNRGSYAPGGRGCLGNIPPMMV